ncbi:class I SAM-dependent methyltransferase [Streptomyces sp. NPDC096152]|uniref:class I SAM-dependent methyltransferase n=1 Tax=Streptomyces sp. NPDC096152 TaxID=3366078 RepID=UPI0038010556
MLDIEHQTRLAWDTYGKHHLERATPLPEVDRISWGPAANGPGDAILGDIEGLRVLDIERARARYPDVPDLRLVHADAVEYLGTTAPYDVIYSLSTFHFVDPHRLLPALSTAVKPGGRLYFTVLHTNSADDGPTSTVTPRPEILRLADGDDLTVHMWVLTPELWEDLLVHYGFRVQGITVLDAPEKNNPASYRLSQIHRPARITARPRVAKPPIAHAAVGVGAVLLGPQGLLLGRHRLGTQELHFGEFVVAKPGRNELVDLTEFTDSTATSAIAGNSSFSSRSTTSSTARTVSPVARTTAYFRATSHVAWERSTVTHRGHCTKAVPETEFGQRLFSTSDSTREGEVIERGMPMPMSSWLAEGVP